MIKLIHTALLIIAFKADLFYEALKDGTGDYINVFERIAQGTDHRKDTKYNIMRASVESAMFGYDEGLGLIKSDKPGLVKAGQEIRRLGSYSKTPSGEKILNKPDEHKLNRRFVPTIRPRYATLNYARLASGPAHWGLSFLELKDECRTRSTYICQDSFNVLLRKAQRRRPKGGFRT